MREILRSKARRSQCPSRRFKPFLRRTLLIVVMNVPGPLLLTSVAIAQTDAERDGASAAPWRIGVGGGAFFSTMGDWHNRTGRNQAEFDFETFPGMSFHVQYAAPLYRDEGRSKDVARSRDTIGYGGIRLEYMRISSRDVNTGARNANPSEMSKTDLTGHIVSLTVGGRGGGLHGGHFGIGPAIASFRAEETIMSQPTPTKIVTEATGFGLTLGTGYSLRLNRHLFWRVVGIDYYLFFGADLDLPDFGSNLGMVAIGSKITIVP